MLFRSTIGGADVSGNLVRMAITDTDTQNTVVCGSEASNKNVVTTAMNAHPEVVYVARYSYLYDQTTGKVVYLKFSYKPNARTEKKQLDAAIAEVNKQINTKNMKPAEIVLAYHEFLTSTVAYDTSGAKEFEIGRAHV